MKLELKNSWSDEYICEITKELDTLAGLNKCVSYPLFYHYILIDEYNNTTKCLPIRVPGGTVGGIWIDDNNVITKIVVDTEYVVKTYPNNVNDLIHKFVGEVIEY